MNNALLATPPAENEPTYPTRPVAQIALNSRPSWPASSTAISTYPS